MKISIITICYNSSETLERTFQSMLSQEYNNIEYIVVDGGSTDKTLEIIKSYEPQFILKGVDFRWISEKDKGIYDAMNKGIKLATGNIIGILNSDDYYHSEEILDKVITLFDKRPIDAIYGNLLMVKGKKKLFEVSGDIFEKVNGFTANKMKIVHPTLFVKKCVYENLGLFDDRFKISADKDFVIRMIKGSVVFEKTNEIITEMDIGGLTGKPSNFKILFRAMKENWWIGKNNGFGNIDTLYLVINVGYIRLRGLVKYKLLKIIGRG